MSINLPSDYYLKRFYTSNRQMRLSINRTGYSNSQLVSADSAALKKAVNNLEDIDYDDISTDELYSRVKAYTDTYNNLRDSATDSDDGVVTKKNNLMANLTKTEKEDLRTIGITIKSDGTLKIDEDKFKAATIKDIKKVFSKDNSYISGVKKYASQVNKYQKVQNPNSVVSTLNIGGQTTVVSEADIVTQSLTGSNIDLQV